MAFTKFMFALLLDDLGFVNDCVGLNLILCCVALAYYRVLLVLFLFTDALVVFVI